MKISKPLFILSVLIILLAAVATITGLVSDKPAEVTEVTSVFGERISLYGKGIYRYDSVSMAAQAIAADVVTLGVGIPLLIIALVWSNKEALGGKLLLTGTLGYFLYTYASMTFLAFYNQLFLVYVALFSLSLFALVLAFQQVKIDELPQRFSISLPVKWISGSLIFIGAMLLFMWMGRIVPSLNGKVAPFGLDHYNTLVIQALDLGLIVPLAILSAVLLLRKKPWGFMLSAVILIKGLTLSLAIIAMIIAQVGAGVTVSPVEVVVFPLFAALVFWMVVILFKNIIPSE